MHKLIVFIVAVLYLGVSSGAVVTIHQCMGKVSSVSLDSKEKACKCSANAKKKMPCCKSTSQLVKVSNEHQYLPIHFSFAIGSAEIQHFIFFSDRFITKDEFVSPLLHSPPLAGLDIYIKNNVFRI